MFHAQFIHNNHFTKFYISKKIILQQAASSTKSMVLPLTQAKYDEFIKLCGKEIANILVSGKERNMSHRKKEIESVECA